MAIHIALALSLLESLALAGVLLHWADRVAGARLLVLFLLGVSAWIVGNELPSWTGPVAERPALMLLATAALTSAAFLHFAIAFTRIGASRTVLAAIYGLGLAAMLLSVALPPGDFEPFAGIALVAMPNPVGWVTSSVWAGLAGGGLLVLARGFSRGRGLERRQVAAVMASSSWGLACMSGYGIAALHLPVYPLPLLGLPLYPVILVYGVLRYRVLVANAWARRALVWTLLVGVAGLLAATVGAAVPLLALPGGTGLSGVVAAGAVLMLGGPMRRLAERVVYPGHAVSAEDLRRWRAVLASAADFETLRMAAARLLSDQVNMPVAVRLGTPAHGEGTGEPALACWRAEGGWSAEPRGWDAAPPGVRHVAGFFADMLAEQAARVDGLEASRAAERERQHRDRLAELGALAATVAHDVRNPLNTISMAVALADADIRLEVGRQVRRVARLADDLLDYVRPWRIEPVPLDVNEFGVAAPLRSDGSRVLADSRQLRRVLDNLLDNARLAGATRVEVEVEGDGTAVRVHVCDDGPGIPEEIRERVFQPFVSRRAGGTGLGLAIVARIMEAHGGAVTLAERPGWTTCFTLTLPVAAMTGAGEGGHVLLADDEPAFQRVGGAWLRTLGHRVTLAGDAETAVRAFRDARPDVVLLDLSMPPHMDPVVGLDLIPAFAPAPVIVLTGHADHDLALQAVGKGAWDFVAKPIEPDMLRVVVVRAIRKARLDAELAELRRREDADDLGLVGRSAAMERLRDMVRRLGPTGVGVVVLGPTGTGKELVARALHATSLRARGPFVPVHCGALSAELLESELFGHLRGSFTGAHRDQPGLVETAHGGTLFLDEVGEMPAPMQVKLLRFLQEGTFVPVGGRTQRRADVRVVAATHRDLEAMVAAGSFREDLFYRLKGVVLRTPALVERRGDVPLLAALFLRRTAPQAWLAPDALAWLSARDWPGNVRELRSVVEVAGTLAGTGLVDRSSLRFAAGETEPDELAVVPALPPLGTLDAAMAELETRMLLDALAASSGNQSEAARRLGVSRVGLIKKLTRLGLR